MLKTSGGDRETIEILALVLQHDEQAVLSAVEFTDKVEVSVNLKRWVVF